MKELDAAQAQLDAGKAQLNSQKADVTTQLRDAITELDKQIPELEKKIASLQSRPGRGKPQAGGRQKYKHDPARGHAAHRRCTVCQLQDGAGRLRPAV